MKVILDMDLGVDDAIALAYAVGSKDIELLGVTGTYGNVYVDQGVRNCRNVLGLLGAESVPVVAGIPHALGKERFDRLEVSARIHGDDGLGNAGGSVLSAGCPDLGDSCGGASDGGSAVDFIVDAARRFSAELTLITTGPLTNVAAAIRRDEAAMRSVAGIVMMGGALTVTGNVSEAAEANVSQDPIACRDVLESGVDVTMVGLDVTSRSHLTLGDVSAWRSIGTQAGRVFADMLEHYIGQHADIPGMKGRCYVHDPSAVICAVRPELFQVLRLPLTCLVDGGEAGRTVCRNERVEYWNEAVTRACVEVNSVALEEELRSVVAKALGKGAR